MRLTGAAASTCTSGGTATPGPTSASSCPEFPNLFLIYGPNTNIVINGSIIYFSECEAALHRSPACACCSRRATGASSAGPTCTTPTTSASTPGTGPWPGAPPTCNTWYKNAKGRVAQNWPFSLLEYWQQTRAVNDDDYIFR